MNDAASTAIDASRGLDVASARVQCSGCDATGLDVELAADGTFAVRAQRLAMRDLRIERGSSRLEASTAVLSGVSARVRGGTGDRRPELVELIADEIALDGVSATLDLPRVERRPMEAPQLDALDELEGLLRAVVTDAFWFVDATIEAQLAQGSIDFNHVDVENIGPDSTLSVDARGLHAETPGGRRIDILLFDGRQDAARAIRRGAASGGRDRGALALRPLVESLLKAPADEPVAKLADAKLQGAVRRTALSGHVQLGDGALGSDQQQVMLSGRAHGNNRVELHSPALGERLVVNIASLLASAGRFDLGGRGVSTGAICASLEAVLLPNAADAPGTTLTRVGLAVSRSTVRNLTLSTP